MSDLSDLEEFELPDPEYTSERARKVAAARKRTGVCMPKAAGARGKLATQRAHMNKDSGRVPPLRRF